MTERPTIAGKCHSLSHSTYSAAVIVSDNSAAALRPALVHDFLLDLRGAERVFLELCAMWPDAPIFTAVYDERGTEGRFAGRTVRTSFLQRLRPSARNFRVLLPLYPAAIESLDLSDFDLVVSSSSAWAHGVRCRERSVHVSYCHNPFRYAWNERDQSLARLNNPAAKVVLRHALARWRHWDLRVANRTDRYIANSFSTQARIRQYFGRSANVVYPPVETERFSPGRVGDYYAIVSELMPHKRIDLAISAFNRLRLPLVIVGDGPDSRRLRRLAGPTVKLTGRVSDSGVAEVLRGARALIMTSVEEFGIAAVECQAAGRPVIARRAGGALETVLDGVTGCFWSGGADELAQAVLEFDDAAIDPAACTSNAARFSRREFRAGLLAEINAARAKGETREGAERHARPRARAMTNATRVGQR
jgi:glycosyltransferase involved in cell wall biosynthesis